MGIILVENIRLFSHHGCLIEETKIGSEYRVDLKVEAHLKTSAKTDKPVSYTHLDVYKRQP